MTQAEFYGAGFPYRTSTEYPGRLIVLEGTDGVGRSTQIAMLRRWLEEAGYAVSDTGLRRSPLTQPGLDAAKQGHTLGKLTMSLFYATDFADRLENQIIPALRAGFIVLSDRYFYSVIARDVVRGADPRWARRVYGFALKPDLVMYLRTDLNSLVSRIVHGRGFNFWEAGMDVTRADNLYDSFIVYQTRLIEQLDLMSSEYNFVQIDASRSVATVNEELRKIIRPLSTERLILKEIPAPTPTAIYGASLILRHLDALVVEITGVRAAQDIEYIHRMRVASRRLRNALPIFQSALPFKKMGPWGKEIRRITRSLGAARDLDVQLDSLHKFLNTIHSTSQFVPGIRRLILRLEQQRAGLQANVIQALDHFEGSNIPVEMHNILDPLALQQDTTIPPHADLYHLAYQTITARLVDFFQREIAIRDPENITELHAQRITAKHLRYTLELFSPLYSNELRPFLNTCRKFQDQLGLLHDCDVWIALLPEFMAEEKQKTIDYYGRPDPYNLLVPGLMEFQLNRLTIRKSQFVEFLDDWDTALSKSLWEKLRTQITIPLISPKVFPTILYPPPAETPLIDQLPDQFDT